MVVSVGIIKAAIEWIILDHSLTTAAVKLAQDISGYDCSRCPLTS
jgi:hypothetical protein